MKDFNYYITEIEKLKKEKNFNQAFKLANDAMAALIAQKDEYWYDMYYQMADISIGEKKWKNALFFMALVVHHNGRIGGATHERIIKNLLKQFNKENQYNYFIELSIQTKLERLKENINELIT
jgi:hypothetical protein